MMDHDPYKSPKRPWQRKKDPRPADQGRYDAKFYKRRLWQGVRNKKLWENPYCEISEAYGELVDGEHVDHIVPRSHGGSEIDPRNQMTLTAKIHGLKSALERTKGCLVDTIQTEYGLIPRRREEIIEYLGEMIWGRPPERDGMF